MSEDVWWHSLYFTWCSSRKPRRRKHATKTASLGNVSMVPASVTKAGSETNVNIVREDSSKSLSHHDTSVTKNCSFFVS